MSAPESVAPAVVALVLAAGRSSRMGALKPLLPFGKGKVVGHVVDLFRRAGVERIHVVVGHRAEAIAPELTRLRVIGVDNPAFDSGMSSSVRAGIASLPPDVEGCLLLPVDMPLVRTETIRRVLSTASTTGAALVHPTFRGRRGHPPFIARSLFGPILAADASEPVCAVLERQDACEVPVFDRCCLEDMDTPEAYQRLVQALPHRDVPDAEECAAMLDAAGVGEPVRRHGQAVADLAGRMALRLRAAGARIDVDLVRAAALVHDIAKGRAHHAEAGAALVAEYGFPRLATVVASHMAFSVDGDSVDERAVVFLADKLVRGEDRVSLAERFAPALLRWRDDPAAMAGVLARRAAAEAVLQAVGARIDLTNVVDAPE